MPRWTEEAREIHSERMRGNQNGKGKNLGNQNAAGTSWPHTKESKAKIGAALRGNKHAVSHGRPKGIPQPLEWRKKMSKLRRGKNNNMYIDGLGRERAGKRNQNRHTLDYRLWREAVFERDDFTCQDCGLRGVVLHGHHIKGWAEYPELRYDVSNGQTLCEKCHLKTRKKIEV